MEKDSNKICPDDKPIDWFGSLSNDALLHGTEKNSICLERGELLEVNDGTKMRHDKERGSSLPNDDEMMIRSPFL
jgi:hypothetical protein